jgi:hypothetical protein
MSVSPAAPWGRENLLLRALRVSGRPHHVSVMDGKRSGMRGGVHIDE